MVSKFGQLRIQQMAFMIVAVFFFFLLVGLFYLSYQSKTLKGSYDSLQKEQAISSLDTITGMQEFTCGDLCIDEDKLQVMASKTEYSEFLPISSLKVYKIYPAFSKQIKCPAPDCNYYDVLGGNSSKEMATYVSLCTKIKKFDYVYSKCEIAKLLVGVK